jgi:hypothetical protein
MSLFDFWRKQPTPTRPTPNPSPSRKESEEVRRQLIDGWMRAGVFDAPNKDEWTIFRGQRRFLEAHPELLSPQTDPILREMMAEEAGKAEQVRLLRSYQRILQQARAHRGTVEAIRVAYTNIYGGLTLDVPEWLEQAMQRHALQEVSERIVSLRSSITHAEGDPTIPPEATAELYALLGRALRTDESTHGKDRLEEAIASYQKGLGAYRYHRYPERYAELQTKQCYK